MKKIGIFGGTFNPIHNGHMALAENFYGRLKLDRLYLIPTFVPPHKGWDYLAPAQDRLKMCELAAQGKEGFEVSDIEIKREGPSYTLLTALALREIHPDAKLYLIMGGDMYLTVQDWYGFRELAKLVTICSSPRDDEERAHMYRHQLVLDTMGVMSVVCDFDIVPVSSTMIKLALREGRDISGMVPEAVGQYIRERGLYKSVSERGAGD